MRKTGLFLLLGTIFAVATNADAAVLTWEAKAGGWVGTDLVSDGANLYRVGGDPTLRSILRYDGPVADTWTLLTDQNPQIFSHKSPGEGNRSWCYGGRIIVGGHSHPGHPDGMTITMYDIGTNTWTNHPLPVFDHASWGQGGALNASTGDVYIIWTETAPPDPAHPYATAVLDVASGTWGPTYDRPGRIGESIALVNEDTSPTRVFDLIQADRYVVLNIYDLTAEPADFSGAWVSSSMYDLGEGRDFRGGDIFGTDVMGWDSVTGKLYLVGPYTGITLAYDPVADSWQELPTRPGNAWYRDHHVAVANGWLYANLGNAFYAMQLIPEPSLVGLLGLGVLAVIAWRQRRR